MHAMRSADGRLLCATVLARNLDSRHAIIFVQFDEGGRGWEDQKQWFPVQISEKKGLIIRAKPKTEKLPRSEKFPLLKIPAVCFYEARTEVLLSTVI